MTQGGEIEMPEMKNNVWPMLEKLSESREAAAQKELQEGRQKLADCERRQQRLEDMRKDYENRFLSAQSGRVQSVADIAICRGFIGHVEGLQKLLGQQKNTLNEKIEQSEHARQAARMEVMKWNHLNEREVSNARARRAAAEQRVIDEVALTRFACRKPG
jgi:flagellar export protein FliJ